MIFYSYKDYLLDRLMPEYGKEMKIFEALFSKRVDLSDISEENGCTVALTFGLRLDYKSRCISKKIRYEEELGKLNFAELIFVLSDIYASFPEVKAFYPLGNDKFEIFHDIYFEIVEILNEMGDISTLFKEKYVNLALEKPIRALYGKKRFDGMSKSCKDHLGNTYDSYADLARAYGISTTLLWRRYKRDGWDLERALTTPTAKKSKYDRKLIKNTRKNQPI